MNVIPQQMVKRIFPTVFIALMGCFAVAPARAETVIAFWDFNDGFDESDESVQIVHTATIGNGTLYQQRADTDGNGKTGVAFSDPGLGIDAIDGRAMAWDDIAKNDKNDAEIFVEFSTVGYTTIQVWFDVRGNGEGSDEIVSYDFKYDLNPLEDVVDPPDVTGTIKDFAGGISTGYLNNASLPANGSSFIREQIDLSGISEVNNRPVVAIRLDDFRENDQMRIDNFLITGTAIPEPTTALALLALTGLLVVRRNRTA